MSVPSRPLDAWSSGDRYEPYVGRWSRLVAAEFLDDLAVHTGRRWVDVGCGTGALTETILACCDPAEVVGVDPSEAFRTHAAARVSDPRVSFVAGDAQDLRVEDGGADAVVSGLVLNFVPPTRRPRCGRCAGRPGRTASSRPTSGTTPRGCR